MMGGSALERLVMLVSGSVYVRPVRTVLCIVFG